MPEVCESNCRMVISEGEGSEVKVESLAFTSFKTTGFLNSGIYLEIGSSKTHFPSSTKIIMAVVTMGLVMDANLKISSTFISCLLIPLVPIWVE